MNSYLNRILALRYLEGKCTLEEIQEVGHLLKVPSNMELLQRVMEEHWSEIKDDAGGVHNIEHVLENIHTYIKPVSEQITEGGNQIPVIPLTKTIFSFWRIAASIIFLILASVTLYYPNSPTEKIAEVSTAKEVTTLANEVTNIKLPDGTMVRLNSNSKLRYSANFSVDSRDVFLEGEGYFDVFHLPEKPFIVHARDLDVKVLGTAFNVKSYATDRSVETTVLRGKVVIENCRANDSSRFELTPNERAIYSKDTKQIKLSKVDAQVYTAWVQTTLIFEEESLDHVIQALEKRYMVKIHIPSNQAMDCKFTARIQNESLEETLELLKSTTSITYEITGDQVFMKGQMCD